MVNGSRKTSGRYKLVCLSNNKSVITIACDSGTGKILAPSNRKVTGADLETLDIYILEHFKNKEALCTYLKNLGYPVSIADACYFSYQHDKTTKYLELVYQNEELHDLAVLCKQYKKQFSNYAVRNRVSSKKIRRLISEQISHEELWKNFYSSLLSYIHEPDFYSYLIEKNLLGERALGFIYDYLNNESCSDKEQQEAFRSAKYYLIDTFTAYKPIRGMIVSRKNYFSFVLGSRSTTSHRLKNPGRKASYFGNVNPFDLISETQLWYLEDHPYFCNLSKAEKEDFILSTLGLTKIPWYERTIYSITQEQISTLEEQLEFSKLTYLEKIRYANNLFAKINSEEEEQPPYQKKKV